MLQVNVSASYGSKKEILRNVQFDMRPGEILGLAGESGSGKSTLALALVRLLHFRGGSTQGHIFFEDRDLLRLPESQMRPYRGRVIAYVPQSPTASLNPALCVRTLIAETWRAHNRSPIPPEVVITALSEVSLPASDEFLSFRPGQLSVGQCQRLLIALALLHQPKLIVADESTSALDPITQQEILRLFQQIRSRHGTSILFISHDLACVARICDRVAIMYRGEIVEIGETTEVFGSPRHSYARRLIGASLHCRADFQFAAGFQPSWPAV